MNRKNIIIFTISAIFIIFCGIIYVLFFNNNSNQNNQKNSNNNLESINTSNLQKSNQFSNNDEIINSPYIIPSSLLYKLKINENNPNMSYYYSFQNKIAFTYETKSINKKKDISVTEGHPDIGDENKVYLFFTEEDNIQSGQSIEIINIYPNLQFNTVSEIIYSQILNSNEKEYCRVENKDDKYFILSKDSTKKCGNYSGINNKFFIKPSESGTATSKLIFVNAGSQELSYDGSGKGKYWYESVIVE